MSNLCSLAPLLWGNFSELAETLSGVHYDPAAAAKSHQSCPTLCDPIDDSPPSSPVPGILQARTLEWVAISFSKAWKWKGKVKPLSSVWLLATPWTAAHQAPPSMGFSRQEYWSGVPLPSPGSGIVAAKKQYRCTSKCGTYSCGAINNVPPQLFCAKGSRAEL